MTQLIPFFLVFFAAVFFSSIFRRLNVPWVVALILGGIVIGPHVLDLFQPDPTVEFFGQIGLVFLMFMAGLETRLSSFTEFRHDIIIISLFNSVIPFGAGVSIGYLLGYDLLPSIFLGVIFISSSIAVIIPSLESAGLLGKRVGKSIVAATIVEDIASLVALSLLLQTVTPITNLPLPAFYILLLLSLLSLRWVLPRLQVLFSGNSKIEKDAFQQELRSVIAVLIGTVIVFEAIGLHPIIAGFFAGLVLSGIESDELKEKIRTISYGIFIPIFFIIIGSKTDISIFWGDRLALGVVTTIVLGSIGAKFFSGFLAGRLSGFPSSQSALIGVSTIPQLSTTLAVVFTGVQSGVLDETLIAAMVALSITTVLLAPFMIRLAVKLMSTRKMEQADTPVV